MVVFCKRYSKNFVKSSQKNICDKFLFIAKLQIEAFAIKKSEIKVIMYRRSRRYSIILGVRNSLL